MSADWDFFHSSLILFQQNYGKKNESEVSKSSSNHWPVWNCCLVWWLWSWPWPTHAPWLWKTWLMCMHRRIRKTGLLLFQWFWEEFRYSEIYKKRTEKNGPPTAELSALQKLCTASSSHLFFEMLTQVTMNAGANSINQAGWGLKERIQRFPKVHDLVKLD